MILNLKQGRWMGRWPTLWSDGLVLQLNHGAITRHRHREMNPWSLTLAFVML